MKFQIFSSVLNLALKKWSIAFKFSTCSHDHLDRPYQSCKRKGMSHDQKGRSKWSCEQVKNLNAIDHFFRGAKSLAISVVSGSRNIILSKTALVPLTEMLSRKTCLCGLHFLYSNYQGVIIIWHGLMRLLSPRAIMMMNYMTYFRLTSKGEKTVPYSYNPNMAPLQSHLL